MSLIKRNLAANLVGNLWMPLLWAGVVPPYVKLIGVEAFGLIGLFVTLQILLSQFDLGLSMALNRELARLSVQEGTRLQMRELGPNAGVDLLGGGTGGRAGGGVLGGMDRAFLDPSPSHV